MKPGDLVELTTLGHVMNMKPEKGFVLHFTEQRITLYGLNGCMVQTMEMKRFKDHFKIVGRVGKEVNIRAIRVDFYIDDFEFFVVEKCRLQRVEPINEPTEI